MTKLKVGQGGESMNHFQINLTDDQKMLHQKAVDLSQAFRKCEYELIEVLREVDKVKLFRHLGYASLFRYAVDELKLSESQAYSFITVARKSVKVRSLAQTLKDGTLTVSKASRIASSITSENADDLISFAKTHTSREIDLEVLKINPKEARRQSVILESDKSVRLAVSLSSETYEKIKRVQDLLAQKGKSTDLASTIDSLLDEYLIRHDPVVKAKRVLSKKKQKTSLKRSSEYAERKVESSQDLNLSKNIESEAKNSQITLPTQSLSQISRSKLPSKTLSKQSDLVENETSNSMSTRDGGGVAALRSESGHINAKLVKTKLHTSNLKREPIPAHVKHQVYLKHEGRCSFVDAHGERCTNSRYLHIHHIRPVSLGGGSELENLSLLCASHHELVHQLSFPIEGQVSWLGSIIKNYGVPRGISTI